MFRLGSDEERIVSVLHDIVEETDVTLEQLKELGYPDRIVEAIDYLTWRKEQETYDQYAQRLKLNPLAANVKRRYSSHT
jgi:(p)ppGpp synthase/HD superfamily hydrolase